MSRSTVIWTGTVPTPRASVHDRILQAAKHLFASKGYDNISTAAIARLAQTSESQLVKYFGSKDGLLEAIFNQIWQKITWDARHAMRGLESPGEKLTVLIEIALTAIGKDPAIKVLMLFEGRRVRKDGQMVMLDPGFLEFVRLTDDVLRQMRDAGEVRSDLHLEGVRSALMGALEGLLRDQLLARRVGYPARYSATDTREIFNVLMASLMVPRVSARNKRRRV